MPRTDGVLPDGWRRSSTEYLAAERLARDGQGQARPKAECMTALKRVAAALGLKAGDVLLLDTLAAFSQPQDWGQGASPLVWPSNARLMEQTGFSRSALKRHLRRLCEAGLIGFRDSPNGKRWGRRSAQGTIVEAYGIDLGPLAARTAEFERLYDDLDRERQQCARLKREIASLRRTVRSRIETAMASAKRGPWARLLAIFEALLARMPRRRDSLALAEVKQRLARLARTVDLAWMRENARDNPARRGPEMAPLGSGPEPHIPTTIKPQIVKEAAQKGAAPLTLPLDKMATACPVFETWCDTLSTGPRTPERMMSAAHQLAPMVGIREQTWHKAQEELGPRSALAAFMLIFDKHCDGEVRRADAYLQSLLSRAKAGALHLERSLYGRLARKALC